MDRFLSLPCKANAVMLNAITHRLVLQGLHDINGHVQTVHSVKLHESRMFCHVSAELESETRDIEKNSDGKDGDEYVQKEEKIELIVVVHCLIILRMQAA